MKIYIGLQHLVRLFIPENKISVYSDTYSKSLAKVIDESYIVKFEDLSFSLVNKYFQLNSFNKVDKVGDFREFSIKGDTVSFWEYGYPNPIRVEFFGEECEKIYLYDELFGNRIKSLNKLILFKPTESLDTLTKIKFDNLECETDEINKFIITSVINEEFDRQDEVIETGYTLPPLFYSNKLIFQKEINTLEGQGYKVFIDSKNYHDEKHIPNKSIITGLPAGYISEKDKIVVFTDREIFGTIRLTGRRNDRKEKGNIAKLLRELEGSINIGDYIVHEDYGIGIYNGMTQELIDGEMREYIYIKYDKDDELYVPLTQISKITKYIGPEGIEPKITRLGRVSWENIKTKIKKSAHILAKDLLTHFAKREISSTEPIDIEKSELYEKFVNEFQFEETIDQLTSVREIFEDFSKEKPMDRVLIGDVGFGKTEVIMRSAFKIIESGGQVAILCPTTLLSSQHFDVFSERFKNFPVTIAEISRFRSKVENNRIIELANDGKIDILIGTHRLLSNDIHFKNLKLVVVDEEQRFGVVQKEKIKKLNYSAHLLSVSATPIPRTLGMALSSLQSISIISTPPTDRKSIETKLVRDDWEIIKNSIYDEIKRKGQVFFINNEISTIQSIKKRLETLAPNIKFVVAHGQMNGDELDKIMTDFYEKKYDCLISTTIIENGIDIPNVNTIIINNAQNFGLSQLYQLRGRVGRSSKKAYCYLKYEGSEIDALIDSKKKNSKKYLERLKSLVDNQDLGAGFRIASKDLELRGAGNLLGEQQSGHISSIGYALFIEILSEEIEKLKINSKLNLVN